MDFRLYFERERIQIFINKKFIYSKIKNKHYGVQRHYKGVKRRTISDRVIT